MVVLANAIEDPGSAGSKLEGADRLIDSKRHASTSDHNSISTIPGQVCNIRQGEANKASHSTTKELVALVHDKPSNERGRIEFELHEYGNDWRVLGPVIGVYGSGSRDLRLLRDLATSNSLGI